MDTSGSHMKPGDSPVDQGCYIQQLPERLANEAAVTAKDVNPLNAPGHLRLAKGVVQPEALVMLTTKYWGPASRTLTVSFMEPHLANNDLQNKILSHMNAWQCSIKFELAPRGQLGVVRISLTGSGFWSYLGTDILLVPDNKPTMNLQGFSLSTSDSEYRRVVRHETGHTLGFPHEHLRREIVQGIDREKAYAYFADNYGWSPEMVDRNVLTPLEERSIMGTPVDMTSIMCYQLPGTIMIGGRPVLGGLDINNSDRKFCCSVYPPPAGAVRSAARRRRHVTDWDPADDVDVEVRKRALLAH